MERYILGIDIGTTSVKALLISESGALAAEGKADHDLISAHPGWAEENAEVWWSNAVAAVRQITDAHPDMAENIVSAGVSGMVPALALNGGRTFPRRQSCWEGISATCILSTSIFRKMECALHRAMERSR